MAPIGVQNIFVINSASSGEYTKAILNAFIVAFFDITLALACFYGIGKIMQNYGWLQMSILLVGGWLLVFIGIKLLCTRAEPITAQAKRLSTKKP